MKSISSNETGTTITEFKKLGKAAAMAASQIYRYSVTDLGTDEQAWTDSLEYARSTGKREVLIWDNENNCQACTS